MDPYATSHYSHRDLLADLKRAVARERGCCAVVLSRIAEVDERRLFVEEGYPSMYAYCIGELNYTEDAAYKRIYAARAGRRFPLILVAVADGRLHLSGAVLLSKHLTAGNVDELVAAATHRSKAEVAQLIAERFPRPDLPDRLQALSSAAPARPAAPVQPVEPSPAPVAAALSGAATALALASDPAAGLSPGTVEMAAGQAPAAQRALSQLAPGQVGSPRAWVTPLAPERFGLQVTLDRETHDLLQQARDLMSHQNPTGEIGPVLKSALKLLVGHLEKRRFAATGRPRDVRRSTSVAASPAPSTDVVAARAPASRRRIPAHVKRAVCERDEGRCTFVSGSGMRCGARALLQFDHVEPVARGGASTVENLRLRCASHNRLEAERAFGVEFMEQKRRAARKPALSRPRAGPESPGRDLLPGKTVVHGTG